MASTIARRVVKNNIKTGILSVHTILRKPSQTRNVGFLGSKVSIFEPSHNFKLNPSLSGSRNLSSQQPNPEVKHQEIEGPTVERDLSELANQTRQALEAAMRSMYGLSRAVAVLGLVQLGVGAWLAYPNQPDPVTMGQSVVAFGFPFSMAFLLRWCLKPMYFFKKMEEQARLQILTLTLQVFKSFNQLFVRLSVVSYMCLVGLSFALLFAVFSRSGLLQ